MVVEWAQRLIKSTRLESQDRTQHRAPREKTTVELVSTNDTASHELLRSCRNMLDDVGSSGGKVCHVREGRGRKKVCKCEAVLKLRPTCMHTECASEAGLRCRKRIIRITRLDSFARGTRNSASSMGERRSL